MTSSFWTPGDQVPPNTNYIRVYDSVAELRADTIDLDTPIISFISSYFEDGVGQGGSGFVRWNTDNGDDDNNGTVFKLTSTIGNGRQLRIHNPGEVNVQWFGAIGDGTNATDAFLDAKDALALVGAGKFVMPAGEYLLDDNIIFEHGELDIGGDGMGATKLIYADWDSGIIVAKGYPVPTETLKNIHVHDFEVDGGNYTGIPVGANDTYGNGININGCDNAIVERCYIHHTNQQGLPMTYFPPGGDLNIKQKGSAILNCRLHDIPAGLICIGAEGISGGIRIANNTVEGLKAGGVGIWISGIGIAPALAEQTICYGNRVIAEDPTTANGAIGIWVNDLLLNATVTANSVDGADISCRLGYFGPTERENFNTIVSSNQFLNWYTAGIIDVPLAAGTTGRRVLQGNIITSPTILGGLRCGIFLGGETICSGNFITGGRNNIYLNQSNANTVTGNVCKGAGSVSILVADVGQTTSQNIVTGNIVDNDIYDDNFGDVLNTNYINGNINTAVGGDNRGTHQIFGAARVTYGTASPVTVNYPYPIGSIHFNITGTTGAPIAWTLTVKAGGGDTWTPWANL